MRTLLKVITAGTAAAALGLLAAGCGGSSSSANGVAQLGTNASATGTSTTPGNAPASRQDFQTAILSFTKCMRANGVQIADPTFNGNGGGGGGGLFRLTRNRNDPKFRKAMTACRSKLAAIRPQFSPGQQQQFQAQALKFAQCMRRNGVDMPDPDFSQGGGGRGLFGGRRGINPNDPKVRTAFQTCQKQSFGNNGPGGRGGFRFGGGPPPGGAPGGGAQSGNGQS